MKVSLDIAIETSKTKKQREIRQNTHTENIQTLGQLQKCNTHIMGMPEVEEGIEQKKSLKQ